MNRTGLSWGARCATLALGWALVACEGSTDTTTFPEDDAGSSELDAGGSPDSGGGSRCGSEPVPFVPVLVQARAGFTTEWNGTTPIRVRLVERGAGLPPEGTRGDFDAYRDQVGWLRLGAPAGTGGEAGDAGAVGADAGTTAGDAGSPDGDAGDTSADVPTFIVGPRTLVDLPVALGDELILSVQHAPNSPLYPGADRVVLGQADGAVLFFHEDGDITSPAVTAGFSRRTGATVCESDWAGCADSHRKELQVTVPGGATATLAPGQTRTIGAYHVSHGTTTSLIRQQPNTCTDLLFDLTNTQLTAVRLPAAE